MRVSRRRRERFQHAGKRPDDSAKDSSMLESVPATARRIPACWKVSRRRRERFQHAGKCPGDGAKDSSMLESVPATARKIPACWKASRQWRERFQHAGKRPGNGAKDGGCAMYTHYDTHTHLALYSNSVIPIKQKWHHTSRAMPLKNL